MKNIDKVIIQVFLPGSINIKNIANWAKLKKKELNISTILL